MTSFHAHRISLFVLAALLVAGCADDRATPDDYADTLAREHAADTPQSNVSAMVPTGAVTGGPVTYGEFSGYEAYPDLPDSAAVAGATAADLDQLPGIILIHEWWGLNENMRAHADQLAGEGYRVLAVDLYGGNVTDDPEEASALVRLAMEREAELLENLAAAYAHLSNVRGAPEVGVMGYCFGGGMALNAALAMPEDLDALVIYYGNITAEEDRLEALDMPILGIFGGEDQSIPVERVREFEETLNSLDKDVEVHVFEGAGHAFANPSGDSFAANPAQQAWTLTRNFLQEHLSTLPAAAGATATE